VSQIDPSSELSAGAATKEGIVVWGPAQIGEGAVLGAECVIGRGTYVGPDARIGERVKVQNLAHVYEPAVVLREGCSVGARAVWVAPVEVVHDVPDFALLPGTPARRIGSVGPAGAHLLDKGSANRWRCAVAGALFMQSGGRLRESGDHD
jgi:UDP-2-acetamido-3-amino-2,3-dideoxy-glucuronate N-acetyltransferase